MSEGQEAHRTSYAVVATTAAAPERDPVLNKSFDPRALANMGAAVRANLLSGTRELGAYVASTTASFVDQMPEIILRFCRPGGGGGAGTVGACGLPRTSSF